MDAIFLNKRFPPLPILPSGALIDDFLLVERSSKQLINLDEKNLAVHPLKLMPASSLSTVSEPKPKFVAAPILSLQYRPRIVSLLSSCHLAK